MQLIISVPFPINMVYYSFRKHCCLTQFITVFVKYWLIDCILSRLLKTTGKSSKKKTNIKLYILNYHLRINKAKNYLRWLPDYSWLAWICTSVPAKTNINEINFFSVYSIKYCKLYMLLQTKCVHKIKRQNTGKVPLLLKKKRIT